MSNSQESPETFNDPKAGYDEVKMTFGEATVFATELMEVVNARPSVSPVFMRACAFVENMADQIVSHQITGPAGDFEDGGYGDTTRKVENDVPTEIREAVEQAASVVATTFAIENARLRLVEEATASIFNRIKPVVEKMANCPELKGLLRATLGASSSNSRSVRDDEDGEVPVEVVAGEGVSEKAIQAAKDKAREIGRQLIAKGHSPGLIRAEVYRDEDTPPGASKVEISGTSRDEATAEAVKNVLEKIAEKVKNPYFNSGEGDAEDRD
jgi:hypothetical protein